MSCPDLAEQLNHALRMSGRHSDDATMTASTSSSRETPLELLCPELMTKEALIAHLRNRLPAVDTTVNLNARSKAELVELATNLIVPKPKRDYAEMRTRRAAALIAAQSLESPSDYANGPPPKRRKDEHENGTDKKEYTSDSNGIRKRKHSPVKFP